MSPPPRAAGWSIAIEGGGHYWLYLYDRSLARIPLSEPAKIIAAYPLRDAAHDARG